MLLAVEGSDPAGAESGREEAVISARRGSRKASRPCRADVKMRLVGTERCGNAGEARALPTSPQLECYLGKLSISSSLPSW